MIRVKPRLAILGKSSNMVSSTLRYLCLILNNLQNLYAFCWLTKRDWLYSAIMSRTGKINLPEQLKRSEDHNKIKGLHIEGKSDQAQESKYCHGEVEPGQKVGGARGLRLLNTRPFNTESRLLLTDSNQSWNKPSVPGPKFSTTPLHHKLIGRRQEARAECMQRAVLRVHTGEKHGEQHTHLSEKQCNSREQFWTQKIHLQEDKEDTSVVENTLLQHLCSEATQDRTVERVRLQEDPHPVDGHHRICNRRRKTSPSISQKTAVRMYSFTPTHGVLEGFRLHKQVDAWKEKEKPWKSGKRGRRVSLGKQDWRESEPLKMRKVVWGRSSNQCSPLRRAWATHGSIVMKKHPINKYISTTCDKCEATYLPFKTSDLIKLIKVLYTKAGKKSHLITMLTKASLKLYIRPFKVSVSPEHRSSWCVQSFISEEAVSGRHMWSVKSHQTIKLFHWHAHRPLKDNSSKQSRGVTKKALNELTHTHIHTVYRAVRAHLSAN